MFSSNNESETATSSRKRGRPRKNILLSEKNNPENTSSTQKIRLALNPNQPINTPTKITSIKLIQFISEIFKFQEDVVVSKLDQSINSLLKHFSKNYSLPITIEWPGNGNISIGMSENSNEITISSIDDKNVLIPILNMSLHHKKNEKILSINSINKIDPWEKNSLQDLISVFEFVFQASSIVYNEATKEYKDIANLEKINFDKPLNWFEDKKEFEDICALLKNRSNALPQFILNHTNYKDDNSFWIPWPEVESEEYDINLKLSFSTFTFKEKPKKGDYHSWMFSEDQFLKLHNSDIKPSLLKYYRIKVYEHLDPKIKSKFSKEELNQILDIWFSLDSEFGEFRDLKKGKVLRGKDGIAIYKYINKLLLHIKNAYLCDSAKSDGAKEEREKDQIVFRVLMSIAYGRTLYEEFDFEAFTFNNFTNGWINDPTKISQNVEAFINSRSILREMKLTDLYQFFLNDEVSIPEEKSARKYKKKNTETKNSDNLYNLCLSYLDGFDLANVSNQTETPTLGELAKKVYDSFKNKKLHQEDDLLKMYNLLFIPDKYIASEKMPTYYEQLSHIVFTRFFKEKPCQDMEVEQDAKIEPKI